MPSLIRLIMVLGLLGGLAYGAMFALANFVQPKQREMTITIPPQKLKQNCLTLSLTSPLAGEVAMRSIAGGGVYFFSLRWPPPQPSPGSGR